MGGNTCGVFDWWWIGGHPSTSTCPPRWWINSSILNLIEFMWHQGKAPRLVRAKRMTCIAFSLPTTPLTIPFLRWFQPTISFFPRLSVALQCSLPPQALTSWLEVHQRTHLSTGTRTPMLVNASLLSTYTRPSIYRADAFLPSRSLPCSSSGSSKILGLTRISTMR